MGWDLGERAGRLVEEVCAGAIGTGVAGPCIGAPGAAYLAEQS